MKTVFSAALKNQAAAFYLRYEVFVLEQKIAASAEFDALDQASREYLVIFDHELPIATVRYQTSALYCLQPDRLCVKAAYRGQGWGRHLLLQLEFIAKKRGCTKSKLSAETAAIGFYEKLGYSICSDPFVEDGLLCVAMKKRL